MKNIKKRILGEIKLKVIYFRNKKNAPADKPPERDKNAIQENNNISSKEFLVIFIISLLFFPTCILIQNIIKIF